MAGFFTTPLFFALVLVVIAFLVGRNKNTDKKTKKYVWWGVAIIIVLMIWGTGISEFFAPIGELGEAPVVAVTPTVITQPATTTLCAVEDTTVTLSTTDKYTSVAGGGTHRYRINGAPAKEVSDAGTFTASPGDSLEILWGNASRLVANKYYSDVSTEMVPCAGTKTFTKEVIKNTTVFSLTTWNEDGELIGLPGTGKNETIAAGDVPTLKAELRGQYQRGIPYGGVIVCEYNTTTFDDCIVNFGGSKVSVPNVHTLAHTNRNAKAFSFPGFLGTDTLVGSVTLDADDSGTITAAHDDNIIMSIYPNNYYINEKAGGAFEGPAIEDEDDTATGLAGWPEVAYVYVAP